MSKSYVTVSLIDKIEQHPNLECTKLEVATILGWKTAVPKGSFKVGQKIVFIPFDTVLTKESADKLGVTKYLKGSDHNRVGRINLKGFPSFGIVTLPLDKTWETGRDVSDEYGASKYFPPVDGKAASRRTRILREHPLLPRFTDIENMRHFPKLFQDGETTYITEKCHGTSTGIGIIDKELVCRSRNMRRALPQDENKGWFGRLLAKIKGWFVSPKPDMRMARVNWWWFPYTIPQVRTMLEALSKEYKQVALYGETFGSVQYLHYGVTATFDNPAALDWRAFALQLDCKYVDPPQFFELCAKYNVPTVPLIAKDFPFDIEAIRQMSEGPTLINNAGHIREGVVVVSASGTRKILKYVSDSYLMDQKAEEQDTTDV